MILKLKYSLILFPLTIISTNYPSCYLGNELCVLPVDVDGWSSTVGALPDSLLAKLLMIADCGSK